MSGSRTSPPAVYMDSPLSHNFQGPDNSSAGQETETQRLSVLVFVLVHLTKEEMSGVSDLEKGSKVSGLSTYYVLSTPLHSITRKPPPLLTPSTPSPATILTQHL